MHTATPFPSNKASVNDLFEYFAPLRCKIYFSIRVAANRKKQWSNRRDCHRLLCFYFFFVDFVVQLKAKLFPILLKKIAPSNT